MSPSKGKSRASIAKNIRKLRKEGRPPKQCVAVAVKKAGKSRKSRRKK